MGRITVLTWREDSEDAKWASAYVRAISRESEKEKKKNIHISCIYEKKIVPLHPILI